MNRRSEVARLLEQEGVLDRRTHPQLAGTVDRLLREGQIAAVLPGVYCAAGLISEPWVRLHAVRSRHPDATFCGAAAARLSYWPRAPLTTIEAAVRHRAQGAAGISFSRRRISADLLGEDAGWRYTSPALTALDLAERTEGESIDVALRTRAATVDTMREALRKAGGRRGNGVRKVWLLDSRDEPWSAAERRAHRLLRRAGITGWQANLPVLLDARLYYVDIAFKREMLAVEIDGRLHETEEDLFESDRWRQNALVQAGWRVLRFTWAMLRDHPQMVVAAICAELAR